MSRVSLFCGNNGLVCQSNLLIAGVISNHLPPVGDPSDVGVDCEAFSPARD